MPQRIVPKCTASDQALTRHLVPDVTSNQGVPSRPDVVVPPLLSAGGGIPGAGCHPRDTTQRVVDMDEVSPGQWHEAVQALETVLFRSAGFRDESDGQPLVYGYLRSASRRPDYLAVCRRALERYCQRERLQLCTVFADLGIGDELLTRPGLTGLCDVRRLPDSFAAVLVSVNHLSPHGQVAEHLVQQIRGTGARLLFVRQAANTATAGAFRMTSGSCARLPEWWQ